MASNNKPVVVVTPVTAPVVQAPSTSPVSHPDVLPTVREIKLVLTDGTEITFHATLKLSSIGALGGVLVAGTLVTRSARWVGRSAALSTAAMCNSLRSLKLTGMG